MRDSLAMILAGGVGSRLNVLVSHRAKPAVPFGGIYRIIDFALSNCMHSGIHHAAVLTQYKPLSLMRHIGTGAAWDFLGRTREVKILPPRTGDAASDWYKGTADAIRQNMDFIEAHFSKEVLILSGDHIYRMDYQDMVRHHRETGAKVTVAMMTVPWELTSQFGIGIVNDTGRIVDWEEKPAKAKSNLASMGIYVFDTEYLLTALRETSEEDFGHHIIPKALRDGELFSYHFDGYWRDVGTVQAFWEANMDILDSKSGLNLAKWGVCTNTDEEDIVYDRPPMNITDTAEVLNSVISCGCVVKGRVLNSVLSPGVVVEEGATVTSSVLMHDTVVSGGARIQYVIADKHVHFSENCSVGITMALSKACPANFLYSKHLHSGLTLVGKNAVIPAMAQVGGNCIVLPNVQESDWPFPKKLESGESL